MYSVSSVNGVLSEWPIAFPNRLATSLAYAYLGSSPPSPMNDVEPCRHRLMTSLAVGYVLHREASKRKPPALDQPVLCL
jgi:hypothetical protein